MRIFRRNIGDDSGVALITVMLIGAVLAGLGIVVVQTTISDFRSANRDRAGVRTLGAAEAGIADGIGYIRTKGVKQICNTCTTPWNINAPVTRVYPRGSAVVTIQVINAYAPPTVRVGRYLIRSVATTTGSGVVGGSGQQVGKRTIEEIVDVRPLNFPLGVYTASKVNLGGTVQVQQESLFSGSCVDSRYKLNYQPGPTGSNIDPYYNIPAGVHSVSYITDKNISTCATDPQAAKLSDSQVIHRSAACNTSYQADQDALGGAFPGTPCDTYTSGMGDYGTNGSLFTDNVFRDTYGYQPRGLSDDDYARLKSRAIAAGTYFPAGVAPVWPTASSDPGNPGYSPVIYIQNQDVTLNGQLNSYQWQSDPSCTMLHPSVILIVDHGNLNVQSNGYFTGYIFAPDGTIKFNGGQNVVGTMFSKELTWIGNSTVGLNDCFAASTAGGILDIGKVSWREVDSQ